MAFGPPVPPPGGPQAGPPPNQGPGPGGGFVSPAPPVEDTKAANALAATLTIAQNVRLITQDFPQAMETGRQILDLLQQMQAAVKGGQQPPETQAPPV